MSKQHGRLNVAIVGLSFGAEFIPIYQQYRPTQLLALCQRSEDKLNALADAWGVPKRYTDYEALLRDEEIDAVHINTPPETHADMCVQALLAGKHVASTIPMALTVADCKRIVEAQQKSAKKYMMMETAVYTREFLYCREKYLRGDFGKLQFFRSSHQQDMSGWPSYWEGFPPMWNATHAVSPTLALARCQAESVTCFGSGTIAEHMHKNYNSPFAIETTHIRFKDSDLVAEVTRSLYDTARQYRESFDVYGSKQSFEWTMIEDERHILHTGESPERIDVPDFSHLLPDEIARFTKAGVYDADEHQHLSFTQGGGHGGSHPHLVHEFVEAILEDREPYPNAKQAANITCCGILSHESAMRGGERMMLPDWTFV